MKQEKNNRRNFLKGILSASAGIGFLSSSASTHPPRKGEKIKMLTADGKLVEVEKSAIEKKTSARRATNKEVFDWMDAKHKK
jgi:hypothetical protein